MRLTPRGSLDRVQLVTLGLFALCLADLADWGYASLPALAGLGLAMLLLLVAVWTPARAGAGRMPLVAAPGFALLMLVLPGSDRELVWPGAALLVILTVLVVRAPREPWGRILVGLLALAWIGSIGVWLALVPIHIDVISLLRDGALRLAHGQDPYAASYPSTTPGFAHLPYTYSPATVLLALPAALVGNVRLANLILAVGCVGALIALGHRGLARTSPQGGYQVVALVLAVPILTVLVWAGWTEVYELAPFALWLVLRKSHRPLAVLLLALALGTKYSLLLVLLPLFLWAPRMRREILWAALVALIGIYLPFVLWAGPGRFWADTVGSFIHQPVVTISLSLSSLLRHLVPAWVDLALSLVLVIGGLVLVVRRRPSDLSDLLLLSAIFTALVTLASPEGYFNYWALVVYTLLAAILSVGLEEEIGWVKLGSWVPTSAKLLWKPD